MADYTIHRPGYEISIVEHWLSRILLYILKGMLVCEKKFADKHEGNTVDDIILSAAYGDKVFFNLSEDIALTVRMGAAKLWKDKIMIQVSEGSDGEQSLGPMTYLPEERPALARVIDLKAEQDKE